MYPQLTLGQAVYTIDTITPLLGIVLFIIVLYGITKYQGLRFRDIISNIPLIIIITLLFGTYTNFVFRSGYIIPRSGAQLVSLFSISVGSLDFVGIVVGLFISTLTVLKNINLKIRPRRVYVLVLSYLSVLIVLGVGYVLGDSVIGKLNEGFFSVGSLIPQSRIGQLGGSVYPVGIMISARAATCLGIITLSFNRFSYRVAYWGVSLFMIGYIFILQYQNYPRYLIVNIGGLQGDLRTYCCIAIACICIYLGYSMRSVHRFVAPIHEDSVGKAR